MMQILYHGSDVTLRLKREEEEEDDDDDDDDDADDDAVMCRIVL